MVFPYYNNHIIIDFPKLPMIFPWILPVAPCFISSVSSSRPGPAAPSSTCTTASRSLGWGMPWKWMVFMEIPWKILLLSMDFTGCLWVFMDFYGCLLTLIDFSWMVWGYLSPWLGNLHMAGMWMEMTSRVQQFVNVVELVGCCMSF